MHLELSKPDHLFAHSTYLGVLIHGDDNFLDHHPRDYTVGCKTGPMSFHLFHGRVDPKQDMYEWGTQGPTFRCQSVDHTPERAVLSNCDKRSLELAARKGLQVDGANITILYHEDLLVIPKSLMNRPMYYGDHITFIR